MPKVEWFDSATSTNTVLRELVATEGDAVEHGTVVVTASQTAGRGRLGRDWSTPPGAALAVSMLVRDFGQTAEQNESTAQALASSWLPLIAGSAVAATLQPYFGEGMRVGVKWPNDVHVRNEDDAEAGRPGLKLCGILCEMLPDGAVIVGMGINLLIAEEDLPTDRATSLLAAGADVAALTTLSDSGGDEFADRLLSNLAGELLRLVALAAEEPRAVRTRVLRHSLTLGTEVRVHIAVGEAVDGRAVALDDSGALVIDLPTGGQLTVNAADVEHLR